MYKCETFSDDCESSPCSFPSGSPPSVLVIDLKYTDGSLSRLALLFLSLFTEFHNFTFHFYRRRRGKVKLWPAGPSVLHWFSFVDRTVRERCTVLYTCSFSSPSYSVQGEQPIKLRSMTKAYWFGGLGIQYLGTCGPTHSTLPLQPNLQVETFSLCVMGVWVYNVITVQLLWLLICIWQAQIISAVLHPLDTCPPLIITLHVLHNL